MPRLLDLSCGAGGAAMGYHRAGFTVTGVDIVPQPRYPFEFVEADAATYPLDGYDAIHASPPCQDHSPLAALVGKHGTGHLLPDTRARLQASGKPYVIENVMGAEMRPDVVLCGQMFGLRTYRHRQFELGGFFVLTPPHPRHRIAAPTRGRLAAWAAGLHASVTGDIGSYIGPEAMGIDWMTGRELSQAIPPAYTEFIGQQMYGEVATDE